VARLLVRSVTGFQQTWLGLLPGSAHFGCLGSLSGLQCPVRLRAVARYFANRSGIGAEVRCAGLLGLGYAPRDLDGLGSMPVGDEARVVGV